MGLGLETGKSYEEVVTVIRVRKVRRQSSGGGNWEKIIEGGGIGDNG